MTLASSTETPSPRPRLGLAVFFVVAFGVAWAGWIADRLAPSATLDTVAMFWTPAAVSLAGIAASFAAGGPRGMLAFLRRVFSIRFPPWLWALALALPLIAGALTFLAHPGDLAWQGVPNLAYLVGALTLANLWTGPLAEEFGWRGYLFPWLRRRWSPLMAGLAIGPIWTLWHLPLMYDSVFASAPSALGFLAWLTAWSVVLALVTERARGSVLPGVLTHFAINSQVSFFHALLPNAPHDLLPGGLPFTLCSVFVATALAWFRRPRAASRASIALGPG